MAPHTLPAQRVLPWLCFLLGATAWPSPNVLQPTSTDTDQPFTCFSLQTPLCGQVFSRYESCGDNLCRCCGGQPPDNLPRYAECYNQSGHTVYIPRLPASVSYLDFSGHDLSGVTLTAAFLTNVTQLTDLLLADNNLSTVHPHAFRHMPHLTCLDVTGNRHLTMDSFRVLLAVRGLRRLSAVFCRLPSPPRDLLRNVTSEVEELRLTDNAPRDYSCGYDLTAYSAMPALHSLELNLCQLCQVTTAAPVRLKHLEVMDNCLDDLPKACGEDGESLLPELSTLKMSGNHILFLTTACLPALTFLDLSYNAMFWARRDLFNIQQFPRLQRLWLNYVDTNLLPLAPKAFAHPALSELLLEGDNIALGDREKVPSDVLAHCPRLTRLSLTKNDMRGVDDARLAELLGSLPLESLQLSHNTLSDLPLAAFRRFHNLSWLELMATGISHIPDGALDLLPSLQWLNLSHNDISIISKDTFSQDTRARLRGLYLDGNPFTCSCQLLWFRDWFLSHTAIFHRADTGSTLHYTCTNLGGTSLADFSMTSQACQLSHATNVVIVFACSLAIVALTTTSLLFRFRWHIRLALYEAFRGRGDVRRLRLLADHFDYDVFVSYAREDLPWVRQHLVAQLEGAWGLRLCVHERDFIPGNNIVDNIVESVQSSKKVLMVFSRHFVRSQWCQFELTFCMNHVMNYDDVLVIVCVDDVASRHVTAAMMAVLRTTTYLQWAELQDAVQAFWGRLRQALHEVIDMGEAELVV